MSSSIAEKLSDLQEDAIAELMNIGMGHAAASLSTMVDDEVTLSVPSVEFLTTEEMSSRIKAQAGDRIASVRQSFAGMFWGDSFLLFPENDSLLLVRELLHEDMHFDDLTDMEQDVLSEVGNIILNGCLASLSNVLGHDIDTGLPEYKKGDIDNLLHEHDGTTASRNGTVLLVRLDFSMPLKNINGYVIFTLDVASIDKLIENVDGFIANM